MYGTTRVVVDVIWTPCLVETGGMVRVMADTVVEMVLKVD
jgi:hypothetical protein